mgnify:CR=1 FL=1|tara:strand:+ start:2133 stop:3374 length:1242 start_codon:yes stop_codon:yes gene_type:complete
MNKKITFIDLFSGCGGLTEGFLKTGKYESLAHIEWDPQIAATLKKRLKSKWNLKENRLDDDVVTFDMQKTNELIYGNWSDETVKQFGKYNSKNIIKNGLNGVINKKIDLIIGGPPCQAYSIAGRAQDKDSMKNDYRNYLFEGFVEIVDHFKPSMFLFENVPGILSACPGNIPVTERIYKAFDKIGYTIKKPNDLKTVVLDSSDFGVPQKRKRVIIIGVKKKTYNSSILDDIYKKLKDIRQESKKTVRDTIYNYPHIYPIKGNKNLGLSKASHENDNPSESLPNHIPRFHNSRDIKIFKNWVSKKMNELKTQDKIKFYTKMTGKISKHNKYRNIDWDKPSPTIVAHLYKDGLMFIHPDSKQARSITVREAASLQSFDDDYEFSGKIGVDYKMIGNAVPPLMAEKIAQKLIKFII